MWRLAGVALAIVVAWWTYDGVQVRPAQTSVAHSPAPEGVRPTDTAVFAAGCFWCLEADFDKVPGVVSTTSGYTGGWRANPSYQQVSSGGTGHTEAVEVRFDPAVLTYDQLLDRFWHTVDPFVAHRQFCDIGDQYRPEVFVRGAEQRAAALRSRRTQQARFRERIVVAITDAQPFYVAEPYHQNYAENNPLWYQFYRWRCGRDDRLAAIWGPT